MNQVITIRIKKKTLWVSLVISLVVVGFVLFWIVRRKVERQEKFEELGEEHKKMVEKSKEYAMRQHIKHVDEGEKYHKHCGMCNSKW
jgi:ABC-type nickel/cobalt efflux system permease component RcnA